MFSFYKKLKSLRDFILNFLPFITFVEKKSQIEVKMPYESREEMIQRQAELQRKQRERDGGKSFGSDDKDPCKKVIF